MGQQQLILLVLATVIVGLAVVVGIRAATENKAKANADALTQDLVRIASDAQMWKEKPQPFGGQDPSLKTDSANFSGVTLQSLGYPTSGTPAIYTNTNGTYQVSTQNPLKLVGYNGENAVTVCVEGVTDRDISSATKMGVTGGADASDAPAAGSCT